MSNDLFLPKVYGDNVMTMMVQGPQVLFVYWEMSQSHWASVHAQNGFFMRLYQVSNSNYQERFLAAEVHLPPFADNWYFYDVFPNVRYEAELGYQEKEEGFVSVLRSNLVHTPSLPVTKFVPSNMTQTKKTIKTVFPMQPPQWSWPTSLSVEEVLETMPFYQGIDVEKNK